MDWFKRYGIPGACYLGLVAGWLLELNPNNFRGHIDKQTASLIISVAAIAFTPLGYLLYMFQNLMYYVLPSQGLHSKALSICRDSRTISPCFTDHDCLFDRWSDKSKTEWVGHMQVALWLTKKDGNPWNAHAANWVQEWCRKRADVITINNTLICGTLFAYLTAFVVCLYYPQSAIESLLLSPMLLLSVVVVIVLAAMEKIARSQLVHIYSEFHYENDCLKMNSKCTSKDGMDTKKQDQSKAGWTRVEVIQTLLAIFTLGILVVMCLQRCTSQKQLTNQTRAWITVKNAFHQEIKAGQKITSTITFINSGNSPALNLTIHGNFAIRNAPPPVPMKLIQLNSELSSAVIGPQIPHQSTITGDVVMTEQLIEEIKTGDLQIYVWGIAKYDDVFGQHRETGYCLKNNLDTTNFRFCPNNNYAR